jgi:hypothetical protein
MFARRTHQLLKSLRNEAGQAALEFMLMLPFFVVFFLMLIDFGIGMYGYVSVANAAREGARYGAINCGGGTCLESNIKNRAVERSGGFLDDVADVTVSWPEGRDKRDPVVVAVSHPHKLLFFPLDWTIKSCAVMPLEQGETAPASGAAC